MPRGGPMGGGRGGNGKAGGRGKAKNRQPENPEEEQAPPEVQDQESGDRSEEEEEEVLERPDASEHEEEEEDDDGIVQDDGEAWDRERQAAEKIADFYEARPYFFDKRHDLYKNKKKQRSELAKLSQELGGIYKLPEFPSCLPLQLGHQPLVLAVQWPSQQPGPHPHLSWSPAPSLSSDSLLLSQKGQHHCLLPSPQTHQPGPQLCNTAHTEPLGRNQRQLLCIVEVTVLCTTR